MAFPTSKTEMPFKSNPLPKRTGQHKPRDGAPMQKSPDEDGSHSSTMSTSAGRQAQSTDAWNQY